MSTAELPELSPTLDRLRSHVLEHSVKTGTFTLKSGATSSWFLDTKQTACRADGIIAVTDAVVEVFGDVLDGIDAIGGLTMGGDPVAYGVQAVAATRSQSLRSFSVRKEPKAGGNHWTDRRCVVAWGSSPGHRGHHDTRYVADRSR